MTAAHIITVVKRRH